MITRTNLFTGARETGQGTDLWVSCVPGGKIESRQHPRISLSEKLGFGQGETIPVPDRGAVCHQAHEAAGELRGILPQCGEFDTGDRAVGVPERAHDEPANLKACSFGASLECGARPKVGGTSRV